MPLISPFSFTKFQIYFNYQSSLSLSHTQPTTPLYQTRSTHRHRLTTSEEPSDGVSVPGQKTHVSTLTRNSNCPEFGPDSHFF